MMRIFLKSLFFCLFFFLPCMLFAQNNYWSQQYGAKSTLMGGAVVGGVRDNSALFYNPAGIAGIDSANVNISANAYGFESINLKNGAGNGIDLNSFRLLVYPQLISGLIKIKKLDKFKMTYGLLTRFRNDVKMHTENRMMYDVIPTEPGDEYYYGTFDYELNNISQWGGLGIAYKVSPKVYLGFTTFLTYTHFDDRRSTIASADVTQPGYAYTTQATSVQYNVIDHVSLLWKFGAQFDFNRLKLGMAITTPSVTLFGVSRIGRDLEYFNQNNYLPDTNAIGIFPSWIASDDRSGLQAQLRTPLSFSFGAEYTFPKTNTRLTCAVELFFPIFRYTVAKSDEPVYVRPVAQYDSVTRPNFMQIMIESAGVINAAIGIEQKVHDSFTMYGGIRTDFNNTVDFLSNRDALINTLNPTFSHFLHFTTGITYKKGHSDITLGLNYGLGITNVKRAPLNISDPGIYANDGGYLLLQGPREANMVSNIHQLSLIIGYTYYLKRLR